MIEKNEIEEKQDQTSIVVITHGDFAENILSAAEFILKEPRKAIPIGLGYIQTHDELSEIVKKTVESKLRSQKVIILTDMFGGTPSNLSIPFLIKGQVEVITGLNLSMLLYALSQVDKKSFNDLSEGIKDAGRRAILVAGDLLS
ncbi:MAG: PTS system mannose-specific IIA component [bacterium]|jgi:PTS system mannose-specific IIA component